MTEAKRPVTHSLFDDLVEFSKSVDRVYSRQVSQAKKYQGRWVAAYQGRVVAYAKSSGQMHEKLRQLKVPAGRAAIRFVGPAGTYHAP